MTTRKYYKTSAGLFAAGGELPVIARREVEIGDKVALKDNYGKWVAGMEGVVRVYCLLDGTTATLGVEFPVKEPGFAADSEFWPPGCGAWWDVVYLTRPLFADTDDEDVVLAQLHTELAKAPGTAIINGKVYGLTLTARQDVDGLVEQVLAGVTKTIQTVRAETAIRIKAEQEKAQLALPMIPVTREQVIAGVRLFQEGNHYAVILPFHYAPRFLCRDNHAPHAEISAEHQKQLIRDIFVCIQFDPAGYTHDIKTFHSDIAHKFVHYHGHGGECLGIMMARPIVKTLDDAIAFRDRYQKMLESINAEHRADYTPEGLPQWSAIEQDAIPIDPDKIWTTKKTPKVPAAPKVPDTPTVPNTPTVGQIVRVLREYQDSPPECVGAIAKVIITRTGIDIGVEFEFTNNLLHDCAGRGKTNQCWYFPADHLEVVEAPGPVPVEAEDRARKPWRVPPAATTNPPERPFKVGDKVRIRADQTLAWGAPPTYNGGIATIQEITENTGLDRKDFPWQINLRIDKYNTWWANHQALELVEPGPTITAETIGAATNTREAALRVDRGHEGKFTNKPRTMNVFCLLCGERFGWHYGTWPEVICPRDYKAWIKELAEDREKEAARGR